MTSDCGLFLVFYGEKKVDGPSRSILMAAAIDQADAKGRCSIGTCSTINDRQLRVRQSRYGLRGVRIGEAANPGPPKSRVSDEAVDNVLSSLELELTMLESDDEPLVRPVDGRVVVPRVESSPPPTVPASFSLMEVVQRPPFEGLMPMTVIGTPDATLLDNVETDLGVSRGHDEDQVDAEATLLDDVSEWSQIRHR